MSLSKNQRVALEVCHAHGSLFSRHRSDSWIIGRPHARLGRKISDNAVTTLERDGLVAIQITKDGRRARLTAHGEAIALGLIAQRGLARAA